jgi:hypothetical protein
MMVGCCGVGCGKEVSGCNLFSGPRSPCLRRSPRSRVSRNISPALPFCDAARGASHSGISLRAPNLPGLRIRRFYGLQNGATGTGGDARKRDFKTARRLRGHAAGLSCYPDSTPSGLHGSTAKRTEPVGKPLSGYLEIARRRVAVAVLWGGYLGTSLCPSRGGPTGGTPRVKNFC